MDHVSCGDSSREKNGFLDGHIAVPSEEKQQEPSTTAEKAFRHVQLAFERETQFSFSALRVAFRLYEQSNIV